MVCIVDKNGTEWSRRIYESNFHRDLERFLRNTDSSDKIFSAYNSFIKSNLYINERVDFENWMKDNVHYLCGIAFDYKSSLAKHPSLNHLAKSEFVEIFFDAIREDVKRCYPKEGETIRVVLIYPDTGGGHKTPAEAIVQYLSSENLGRKFETHIINGDEESKGSDPLFCTGEDHHGVDLTSDRVFNLHFQRQISSRDANRLWKKETVLREYIPSQELKEIIEKVRRIKPHFIIITAQHRPRYIQVLYATNTPGAILQTDYAFNPNLRRVITNVNPQICKIWVPVNEKEFIETEQDYYDNSDSIENKDESIESLLKKICTRPDNSFDLERSPTLKVLGYPVRLPFQRELDSLKIAQIRNEKGINPDAKVCIISMGSLGGESEKFTNLVRILLDKNNPYPYPMHFVLVSGKNQELKEHLNEMINELNEYKHSLVEVTICGFLSDIVMADYMKIASLYIGKTGGATTAECLAVGLPVFSFESLIWEEPNMKHLIRKNLCRLPDPKKSMVDQIIDRINHPPKQIFPIINWKEKIIRLILAETTSCQKTH